MRRRSFLQMLGVGALAAKLPVGDLSVPSVPVTMTKVNVDLSPRQVSDRLDQIMKQMQREVNERLYSDGRLSNFDVPQIGRLLNTEGEWVPVLHRPHYQSSVSGRLDDKSRT